MATTSLKNRMFTSWGSTRTGSYHQIKGDLKTEEETAERSYFTCWFDHGAAPENDTYSYVLLPDMTSEETKAYSQSPDVEILENSEKLQAVNDHSTNTLAVNFWDEAGGQTNRISCDSQASVIVQGKQRSLYHRPVRPHHAQYRNDLPEASGASHIRQTDRSR